jgi:hypothetical protein
MLERIGIKVDAAVVYPKTAAAGQWRKTLIRKLLAKSRKALQADSNWCCCGVPLMWMCCMDGTVNALTAYVAGGFWKPPTLLPPLLKLA